VAVSEVPPLGRSYRAHWFLGLLAVGCLMGWLGQAHWERRQVAEQLAHSMLEPYINGQNGFQEMRDFFERRRGTDLRGVRVLDTARVMRNRYPREFEATGWPVTAPIMGRDRVVRDWVEVYFRFLPPFDFKGGFWLLVFGFGAAMTWVVREREARREAEMGALRAEAATREAEAARRESEQRLQLRVRDEELSRLTEVWSTFHAQISDDTSQLTNHMQSLNGFITQIDISLKDAVHDLYKAPLLGTGDLVERGQVSLADVKSFLRCLEDRSFEVTREEMAAFVRNVDETMEAIKWVVDGLPEYANREAVAVDPRVELASFMAHLPPVLRKPDDGLLIVADTETPQPLIMFNPAHFRSVVKNALYNAVAAIRRARRHDPDREARVVIRFEARDEERLALIIEDTGDGLSEDAVENLYRGRVARVGSRRRGGKGSLIVSAYLGFNGGQVSVCNRPEGGAQVTFSFRRVPEDVSSTAASEGASV
jgi:signal transduction histidine kinase